MRKQIFPLAFAIILALSCNKEKPSGTTILGEGTPYSNSPEIMLGKVKTVIEKNYWAIPEGESYIKGSQLTKADRDSLGGWTDDFEAVYDENGVINLSTGLDENGKGIWKNELTIENEHISKVNQFRNDTLQYYSEYKYDDKGFLVSGIRNRAGVDTLMFSVTVKTNAVGYPTEYQLFNPKGEPTAKYVQTYDDQNRFSKLEAFQKDGQIRYTYEVLYNDKSKISDLTIRDKDNKITGSNFLTYEYDSKGNWVKAIVKDLKNFVVIEERTYTYFE